MDGSPPASMWMVRAAELFPRPVLEKEDEKLTIPFSELAGEGVKFLGNTDDGVLALSNYRLFLLKTTSLSTEVSIPLGLIESAQVRDLFNLFINCKDASTIQCSFSTSEQCAEWQRRITISVGVPEALEKLFAFPFHAWQSEMPQQYDNEWTGRLQKSNSFDDDFRKEVDRLKFDLQGAWRISHVNADFKLCPSYPRMVLVPACISDDTLQNVASFRSSRRIPAVVWRHKATGAVIARCSQPEVGWLGWRNSKDEQLLKALSDACSFDRGPSSSDSSERIRHNSMNSNESTPSSAEGSHEEVNMDEPKKILIVDARSYTSAVTNRARGGGCECPDYYPSAEIQFMSLGNIHAIRKSFHALRQLCASPPDIPNWFGVLEKTMWLQHMSGLLAASVVVCHAIEKNGRPVLVHCSDGWDRTPQIVATAQLCLDPYYRTVEGFRILVEREWLSFGHKFADRVGHGPGSDELNERCPVFLQWLDCVHQIHRQFPCSFEFSMGYLIKLAQHSHSCLFGTFLCNTVKERSDNTIPDRTYSVWPFLSGPIYKNPLYIPKRERVLWPAHNLRDLGVWSEVYLGSLGNNQNSMDYPTTNGDTATVVSKPGDSTSPMIKTRSYGDLVSGFNPGGLTRRSSDPNMPVESNMLTPLSVSQENSIDSSISPPAERVTDNPSELSLSPNLLPNDAATITAFRKKFENLTQEIIQSVEEFDGGGIVGKQQPPISDSSSSRLTVESNAQNGEAKNTFCSHSEHQMNGEQINSNECDIENSDVMKINNELNLKNGHFQVNGGGGDDSVDGAATITTKTASKMLESIDLNETLDSPDQPSPSASQKLWYGSVETSTDTLVPIIEQQQQPHKSLSTSISFTMNEDDNKRELIDSILKETDDKFKGTDVGDGKEIISGDSNKSDLYFKNFSNNEATLKTNIPTTNAAASLMSNSRYKDLPDVHITNKTKSLGNGCQTSNMDESIVMQPQFQQLEINGAGTASVISNGSSNGVTTNHQQQPARRRRNSSSNSKIDLSPNKYANGSTSPSATTNSRFSTPVVRSLPLTPPGVPIERPPVSMSSCPDGLSHALSEQNLRLQQIVYEHKLREEQLQRELYATRLALLKKTCHNCSNHQIDEQASMADSINENTSVCSWEAVDERSAPSSGSNSATQQQLQQQILWVPDHAVNRCQGCQIEFWLGRRKHHCRNCGNIYCADCSEFWAPLPDERLFTPVRLCAICYQSVTGKFQLQHPQQPHQHPNTTTTSITTTLNNINTFNNSLNACTTNNSNNKIYLKQHQPSPPSSGIITAVTSANQQILEPCKHAAGNTGNDRNSFKTTTATN